jgi:hypothetical protein
VTWRTLLAEANVTCAMSFWHAWGPIALITALALIVEIGGLTWARQPPRNGCPIPAICRKPASSGTQAETPPAFARSGPSCSMAVTPWRAEPALGPRQEPSRRPAGPSAPPRLRDQGIPAGLTGQPNGASAENWPRAHPPATLGTRPRCPGHVEQGNRAGARHQPAHGGDPPGKGADLHRRAQYRPCGGDLGSGIEGRWGATPASPRSWQAR